MDQVAVDAVHNSSWSHSALHAEQQKVSPISRRHLHDELVDRLRDYILAGQLPYDAKVPEKDLCDHFGVSRTPLREALKVLAFEGLVTLNHNRGAVIRPLTIDDLNDAFPIYARLEALAGELACQKLRPADIDELKRLHDTMVSSFNRCDFRSLLAANEQIHARIQAASQNRNLLHIIRCVSSRVRRARQSIRLPKACHGSAIADHERIMEALEKRDAMLLSRAIRDHIGSTLRFFRDAWTDQQDAAAHGAEAGRFDAPKPA
jgi:DNA-binding GntR family transcriptional regulator